MNDINKQLIDFISASPSAYHTVENVRRELDAAGYTELFEGDDWSVTAPGKYYVRRNGSSIIALRLPKPDFRGFMVMAAHSDSPSFKIKWNSDVKAAGMYTMLNVEKYGGMLCSTWLDRPLSVAGRAIVAEGERMVSRLVNGGWEAESDAGRILQGLGVDVSLHQSLMRDVDPRLKVKVLLAQALFGHPDVILLDEPTNNLDLASVVWLEDFLMDYEGTVLVVSHDRYFLNNVCTHIVDIDYGKIKMYVGNYDFWYESSQLIQKLIKDQNKKAEQKIQELQTFIARFSANKSKSRQATSRRKLLDKITVEELPASNRRYPWVGFKAEREPGKDRLFVTEVSKTVDGVKLLNNVSFIVGKEDKIALVGKNELAVTMLYKILMGEEEPDSGTVKWGASITPAYFPKDNGAYFDGCELDLIDWMRQFSEDKRESYLRTFLGRMLFSGDDVYKTVKVLSGGEKVRCMLSRMMLSGANFLLFDQPTNHLDLESIAALNNGMEAFKYNIIFSCHDHQLTQTVANRIIEVTDTGIIDRMCSYDEYMHISDLESGIRE